MLNLTRTTVHLPSCGPQEDLIITFDQPEARGTVILRESPYGLEIILPDASPFPVAVLDFWHTSETGQIERSADDPAPVGQIIIHSPAQADDPVGRVRFFPRRTQVDFERGVERCDAADDDFFFAYPLGDYPPVEQIVNHRGVQVYRALDGDGQPSAAWFTTDPDRADLTRDGPHFRLEDVMAGPAMTAKAKANPAYLRAALIQAIEAGLITADGLDIAIAQTYCPAHI